MGSTRDGFTPQLAEALMSSLDLYALVPAVYTVLEKMIGVDHGAVCVTRVGTEEDYDWAVARLPPEWFARYQEEMAPHDFVRANVAAHPNRVMRDQEMVQPDVLRRSPLYLRSRELDLSLEHVMAVLLKVQPGWHGGVVLYRDSDRPFGDEEKDVLQMVASPFSAAIRNCRVFGQTRQQVNACEAVLGQSGTEVVIMTAQGAEVHRTQGVDSLLERWFGHGERRGGGVPTSLATSLKALLKAPVPELSLAQDWFRATDTAELRASFLALPDVGSLKMGAIVLRERDTSPRLPESWESLLTARQKQVVIAVLRGWDNRLVAADLGCSERTVKKHLQQVFDRLGIGSRAALLARAAGLRH
jgi:DNA-binding CsgD family transcriptional regulator